MQQAGKIKVKTAADPTGESNKVAIQTHWVTKANGDPVDVNTIGDQDLVVKYTDKDGKEWTLNYTVKVQDYVEDVEIVPHDFTGECGKTFEELFNDNNAKVKITMKHAGEFELSSDDARPIIAALGNAGYQNNITTTQTLAANYTDNTPDSFTNGRGFPVSITVKLNDVITAVEKESDPLLEQEYGKSFQVGTGKIRVKTVANPLGSVESINPAWIKEEDDSEYDQNAAPGVRSIKLVYPGYKGEGPTYSITTKTTISQVTVTPNPFNAGVQGMSLDKLFEDANFEYTITYNGTTHTQTGTIERSWVDDSSYSPSATTQTLRFNIPDNYDYSKTKGSTKQGTAVVNLVNNSVASVEVVETSKPKENQKYGTNFDPTDGKVKVTMKSGDSQEEDIQASWIKELDGSNYKNTQLGQRQVKIVYPGIDLADAPTITVNVQDYVKKINVTPSILTGDCGKTLSEIFTQNNVTVEAVMASSDSIKHQITGEKLNTLIANLSTNYHNNSTESQTLSSTVRDDVADSFTNGKDIPVTVSVKLTDVISKIEITTNPTEEQEIGKPLNLSGGKLTITKVAGGAGTPIDIDPAWVTEIGGASYDNTLTTVRQLEVNYPGFTSSTPLRFNVDVKDVVESVTITPSQVNGFIGDTIADIFGANTFEYAIKYKGKADPEVGTLTKEMTKDVLSSGTPGTQTLQFTVPDHYERSKTNGQNAPKNGTLIVKIASDTIADVIIKTDPEEEQKYGEAFNVGSGKVTIVMESGTPTDVAIDPNWVKELDGSPYDSTNLGERQLIIKHPDFGGEGIRINVNVKNYVKEIIASPNDFTGDCGKLLSEITNGIKFKLKYADDTEGEVPDTAAAQIIQNIQGFNTNSILKQTLSFSYTDTNTDNFLTGTPVTGTITVKLSDVVTGITIVTAPQVMQEYNRPYQVGSGMINIQTANNPTGTQYPIQASWVKELSGADYNNKLLGERKLKIVHPDSPDIEIGEIDVNVQDWIQSYEIHKPTNNNYAVGDKVEDRDGYIVPVKASGTKGDQIPFSDTNIKLTYDTSSSGEKTVTVEYNGKNIGNFNITVVDGIEYIKMGTMPKQNYLYGDALSTKTEDGSQDATVIIKKYSETSEQTVLLKNCIIEGYNPKDISGPQTLKVKYQGAETSYTVTVSDFVYKLGIKAPTKDKYPVGAEISDLDLTGGEVWEITASGKTQNRVAITADMITSFDSSIPGTTQVEVTYKGSLDSFTVKIEDNIKDVQILNGPTKDEYKYGENLDLNGAKLQVEKDSGTQIIDITKDMISGYNPKTLGEQELTVTYNGTQVGKITVTVIDYVKGLEINLPKKNYIQGEKLDLTGAKVILRNASGTAKEEAPLTLSMIDQSTTFDPQKLGNQLLKIKYGEYTASVTVNVKKKEIPTTIELSSKPDKTTYNEGEELDLKGAVIKVTDTDGQRFIGVTSDMISGYDSQKIGTQTITITYKGQKVTFDVTVQAVKVEEPVTPVTPAPTPKPKPTVIYKPVIKEVPVEQEPEEPVVQPPVVTPAPTPTPPVIEEKPEVVLGVQDEKDDDLLKYGVYAGISGLAILALLAATKRNTQILVEENGEYSFAGAMKIGRRKARIDVNKFLDSSTYNNKVKIIINKSTAERLDGYELEIIHREGIQRFKVNYQGRAYEINLK